MVYLGVQETTQEPIHWFYIPGHGPEWDYAVDFDDIDIIVPISNR